MQRGQETTTVVYIEDDAELGRRTAKYLEGHGLTVILVPDPMEGTVVGVGRLAVDATARRATLDTVELALTTYEFDLLRVFVERRGRVLSRERLVELVRGSADEAFDRSVDVHISRLRKKLGDDPRNPHVLKTVRGVGYLFAGEGD